MGAIHLGHEQGFGESWQRDRGLHENACEGFRRLAEDAHIDAALRAHAAARLGWNVDWETVIREHIVGGVTDVQ